MIQLHRDYLLFETSQASHTVPQRNSLLSN